MRKNRQEKLANKRNVCHLFRSTCFDVMLTNSCMPFGQCHFALVRLHELPRSIKLTN